ncbi:hypothetical protein D1B31_23670 [Neobacillus notoginsengisoli]|uniref:Reverse transcriptase n=1 Tax=Neobacillus notoginsengisoli TaxID=1578198 RepID=A0A417YD62_9BACI|nr:reverse transcriptase domain-containing protein [Neobacillus notoginsengisoli]RHW30551.1 hypothetical protein D1B31_23670 [Neobacillus notoginsengisoli]
MNELGVRAATFDDYLCNRFSVLEVEEPRESTDDTDTFSNSFQCQTGSSSVKGLGRGFKPVLNSVSNKTQKNTPDEQIPDEFFLRTLNMEREILMKIKVAPSHDKKSFISTNALLDCGANVIFVDKKWAMEQKLPLTPLRHPIPVFNVDGSKNSAGNVTHSVEVIIDYEGHRERVTAEVTDLGRNQIILGYTWLKKHNPEIDWSKGEVKMTRCPRSCHLLKEKSVFLRVLEKEEEEAAYHAYAIRANIEAPPKIEKTIEEMVPSAYHQYYGRFSKGESERMPVRKPWDHAIDLKESFVPRKGRMIPLSVEEQKEVSSFIDEQLRKGYIRPSKSPQTSPVFFVPKKEGTKRMVQDYRYLNEHTVKNNYPLPLISQLVDKLKGAKLFTKMDLRWGYNNVRIKEGDEWKAAFVCFRGAYEPLVMYFGLCNSPATFQAMMNEIFADMDDVVVVYIDDLLIFTKTNDVKEHERIVKEVLRRLEENDLFIKPEKCTFTVPEVEFLGMIVGRDGIKMDDSKVKAILEWPAPKNVRGVRSFLGLANFYRRFIQGYAQVARPLNDLTKKDTPFAWKEAQQEAFDTLKQKFTSAPILAFPDEDSRFRLECDASDFATGGVLSIEKNGSWHPVAYASRSMTPEERNYPIADKEMLSMIQALEGWRHYLEGAKYEFEIWNDHKNLQYFMKAQDLNRRQARWAQYLSRFNFKLVHKPGTSMGKADALSRREDHMIGIEDDNKGVTIITPEKIRATILISDEGDKIKQQILEATYKLKESEEQKLCEKFHICEEKDGILYDAHQRMYVPDDDGLRQSIITLHHDTPVAGHPGVEKTLNLLQRSYFWPLMSQQVKDYVSRCDRCARMKGSNQPPAGKLNPLEVPSTPWEDISADFTTDLPDSNGFDSILVVMDRFSKEVEFIPCLKTTTALDTARLYLQHVWKAHGLPRTIISDRGPQFAAEVMRALCKRLGITPKLSTAHHPQTDGQTERMNRDLEQYLRLFCAEKEGEWADWLAIAQFSYNTKRQASTKKTPFEVTRSYAPRMGFEQHVSKAPAADDFAEEMAKTLKETRDNLIDAQKRMKIQADKHRSKAPEYVIRDRVWLSTSNLRLPCASCKLTERWISPYEITRLVGTNALTLKLPKSMRIHPTVNISQVKPYKERLPGQPVVAPGPIEVTEGREEEYEVDYVVDSRKRGNRLEYLIHWKGYTDEDRTWEPAGNLGNASDAVAAFHRANPSAPRKLRMAYLDFLTLFKPFDNLTVPSARDTPFDRLEVDP